MPRDILTILASLILIAGAIWFQCCSPCWMHGIDAAKNVPGRCLHDLTK